MNGRIFFLAGSVSGFLGVALGAFGAHALKGRLSADLASVYETGVRYQLVHALALLAAAWAAAAYQNHHAQTAGWFFIAGSVVFSGSLYLLVFTGTKSWGAVTPVGGLCLLAGWLFLAVSALAPTR
jgi:uncharacterized membrane protein YgdD (TMEM256/DUF423 family)